MSKPVLFSIIVPTYNRAEIIGETIQSVLNQSLSDFELLVIDDGGIDDTDKVVSSYKNSRVFYYKKDNAERGAARNFGAKKAKGSYVYFLDSDDLLYPNHLEVALQFIKERQPNIFFQQYEFTLESGKKKSTYLPKSNIVNKELLIKGNFMSCHGVFIKRDIFLKHLFNEDRELAGSEDYELWLRLAARYPIYYSSTITSTLVYHPMRSVINMPSQKLILRKEKMLEYVCNDQKIVNKYGAYRSIIYSEAYSYVSLHLVLSGNKKDGFSYLLKAFIKRPALVFRKRFWAILKHLFF